MHKSLIRAIATGLLCTVLAAAAEAQENQPGEPPREPQDASDAWMKASQPGEPHRLLSRMTGKWTAKVRTRNAPDSAWSETEGGAEYESIFEGRFLTEKAFVRFEGMEFHWRGLLGHDNQKGRFVAAWVDNASTGIETAEGDGDLSTGVITLEGEEQVPGAGKVPFKWVLRIGSGDKASIEMHMGGPDGKMFQNMTMELTRAR